MPNHRLTVLLSGLALVAGCAPKAPTAAGTAHASAAPTVVATKPGASAAPVMPLSRDLLKAPAGASTHVQGQLVVDASYLVKAGVGQVISNDGNSAVYPAASMIGNDGASLVASGAGNLIASNAGAIIGNDGATLIGNDGSSLISNDGGGVISNDGASRRLLAADEAVDDQVAAGFAIRAIGLLDNRPVPLGVDKAGKPVYAVLTDAQGHYDLHLPADLAASVRLVASPPGVTDPRATLNLLVDKAGGQDQRFTEPASGWTTYVRQLLLATLRPALLDSADRGKGEASAGLDQLNAGPALHALLDHAYEVGSEEHAGSLTVPQRDFVLQRLVDTIVARAQLDNLAIGASFSYAGDRTELARHAFEDVFGQIRAGAARKLAADPAYFATRPYMIAANARRVAAGKPPYAIRKASDAGDFIVEEYCHGVSPDHMRMAEQVMADLGLAPTQVQRMLTMNNATYLAMGLTLLANAEAVETRMREATREQLGAHAPKLPPTEAPGDAPPAPPTAAPERYTVSTLPTVQGQGIWHMAIGPDGNLYYVTVGPGKPGIWKVDLHDPARPATPVVEGLPDVLGLAFDPTAAVPTLYATSTNTHAITRVLPGPPEVLPVPADVQLGVWHQVACTHDHALIVAQDTPAALLRIELTGDHKVTMLTGAPLGMPDFALSFPYGLAVAADGAIYTADAGRQAILRFKDGQLRVMAGREGMGGKDGFYDEARFNYPQGLALAPDGSLVVSDSDNCAVRRVRLADDAGLVTTLAGEVANGTSGKVDGEGASARFSHTSGVAVDANGVIYVGDMENQLIRVLTPR